MSAEKQGPQSLHFETTDADGTRRSLTIAGSSYGRVILGDKIVNHDLTPGSQHTTEEVGDNVVEHWPIDNGSPTSSRPLDTHPNIVGWDPVEPLTTDADGDIVFGDTNNWQ